MEEEEKDDRGSSSCLVGTDGSSPVHMYMKLATVCGRCSGKGIVSVRGISGPAVPV